MFGETTRRRLKPLASRLGIGSSAFLWQPLAMRQYRRKLAADPEYRDWVEGEASRWVAGHWGHQTARGEFLLAHLASQLCELIKTLRSRLGDANGARVLDAGASDGLFLSSLGIERGIGFNLLEGCTTKIRSDGFAACLGNIEKLPFPDKSFDYVICCETLEHVPNPVLALDELARVCAGRIMLTIPWLPETRINSRPEGWPEVESHIFEFSEADFARIVTHAGVSVVYRSRVQVFPEPRNPVLQWWFREWLYPRHFPKLQYYELQPD